MAKVFGQRLCKIAFQIATLLLLVIVVSSSAEAPFPSEHFIAAPEQKHSSSSVGLHTSEPAIRGDIIVAGSLDGQLFAFDAWNGTVKWKFSSGTALVSSSVNKSTKPLKVNKHKKSTRERKGKHADKMVARAFEAEGEDCCLVPGLDGQIYAISSSGSLESLEITAREIIDSSFPKKCPKKRFSDFFFVGEKKTKLFELDVYSGAESIGLDTADSEPKNTIYVGRSEYSIQAVHSDNGQVRWTMNIGEYFVYSPREETAPLSDLTSSVTDEFPTVEMIIEANAECCIIARHPSTGVVLWQAKLPTLVLTIHGVSSTGKIVYRNIIPGPGSTYFLPRVFQQRHSASWWENNHALAIFKGCPEQLSKESIQRVGKQRFVLPASVAKSKTCSVYGSASRPVGDGRYAALPDYEDVAWWENLSKHNDPRMADNMKAKLRSEITADGLFVTWRFIGVVVVVVVGSAILLGIVCYRQGKNKLVVEASSESAVLRNEIGSDENNVFEGDEEHQRGTLTALDNYSAIRVHHGVSRSSPDFFGSPLTLRRSCSLGDVKGDIALIEPHALTTYQRTTSFCGVSKDEIVKNSAVAETKLLTNIKTEEYPTKKWLQLRQSSKNGSTAVIVSNNCTRSPKVLEAQSVAQEVKDIELELRQTSRLLNVPTRDSSKRDESSAAIIIVPSIASDTPNKLQNVPKASHNIISLNGEAGLPFVCTSRYVNEFEQISSLGKGGFGEVVLARNRLDGRQYAVKKIGLCSSNQWKEQLDRVLREVKILALLDHPNIVRYYQAWLENTEKHCVSTEQDNVMNENFVNHLEKKKPSTWDSYSMEMTPELNNHFDLDSATDVGFDWDRGDHADNQSGIVGTSIQSGGSDHNKIQKKAANGVMNTKTGVNVALDHWLYIQMQYCSNRSLCDFLNQPARLVNIPHILRIISQIASALEHVHTCGLIHRDLKPANILVMDERYEFIKLGDFGLSRFVGNESHGPNALDFNSKKAALGKKGPLERLKREVGVTKKAGGDNTAGVGTYLYASPEQMAGRSYDSKTDMYSLGMILFEICHETFGTSMERAEVLGHVRMRKFPENWSFMEEGPAVCDLIMQLLSKEPSKRPSASDIVEQCERLQGRRVLLPHDVRRNSGNDVLLRVEAQNSDNNLLVDISDAIRKAWQQTRISQCGVRIKDQMAVLEFLLELSDAALLHQIISAIQDVPGVRSVSQV